jgi:hypothetical protein
MHHPVTLLLAIHNHQPVGNFSHVLEESYHKAYLPFIQLLTEHPHIRVTLHYSGFLLEWLKQEHPEFIQMLRRLADENRVEFMSGGFYEPILTTLYDSDKQGQIEKLTTFLHETFGSTPKGIWLAERVWEPHLAESLNNAGAEYIVIDDHHFIMAGLRREALYGYYITEEKGKILKVFPGSERLRYLIPFRPVEETLSFLRSIRESSAPPLAIMGDDGEKFGVWPGTYRSVYEEGWLRCFFETLQDNRDWIEPKLFSEVLQTHPPLGRIYLPTSSYMEMAEWSLLQNASEEFRQLKEKLQEAGLEEMARPFLAGGFWRNFFSKYPESNLLHKKMLFISEKIHHLPKGNSKNNALNELWKGQCNDAYWHGVFGGLYLPHLRSSLYRHLIRAETLADCALHPDRKEWIEASLHDLDKDGAKEVILSTESYRLIFTPDRGGNLIGIDFKPRSFNLQDTFTRVPEFYHKEIDKAPKSQQDGEVHTIHHQVMAKEEGLAGQIVYDPYPRRSLIDHFLRPDESFSSFRLGKHHEAGDFVQGAYSVSMDTTENEVALSLERQGTLRLDPPYHETGQILVRKEIRGRSGESSVAIDYHIENIGKQSFVGRFGVEFNLTLLAGDAPDRYYRVNGTKPHDSHLAGIGEEKEVRTIHLCDEWSGILLKIASSRPGTLWRFPIETVSQSEGGFEKIYQGSCLLLQWNMHLEAGESLPLHLDMEFCIIPGHPSEKSGPRKIETFSEST